MTKYSFNRIINPAFLVSLLVLIIGAPQSGQAANEQPANIISFNKAHYGGANKNWSITFDQEGYTYFGNGIGLVEFDGVSWNLNPSANGYAIRCIKNLNNRIYSAGYRELGYWQRNEQGKLNYHSLTSKVEEHFSQNEEFWDISVLDGKVYFRSFSRIYIYTPDKGFDVIDVDGFITFSGVVDDEFLIALSEKGIYKVSENQHTPVLQSDFFNEKSVTFIGKPEATGEYLIGTESHGMFRYNIDSEKAEQWAREHTNFFVRNNINKGLINQEGEIVIGTILNGIMILDKDGKAKHHINVDSGIQSNTVHAIACDSLGNIWMTSDKGVDFVSFATKQSYTQFEHKEMGAVYSAALYNGFLYMGTNQGLFRRPGDEENKLFQLVPGTQRQVWDCTILDDKLFVGHNSGTFLIDKNHEIKKISSQSGAYSITRVPDRPDHLVQSTYTDMVLYTKENGQWSYNTTIAGFSDLINSVKFDQRGNLWASHLYRGIYQIRLNEELDSAEFVSYYGSDSHIWQSGSNLKAFEVENRIVLTNEEKLYTYNDLNDSIVAYDFLNENLGSYSSSFLIKPAPSNHYWFMNDEGVALFHIRGNNVEKIKEFPITLFKEDLIPTEENLAPIDERRAILCLENGYGILDASAHDAGERITEEELTLREVSASNDAGKTTLLSPYENKITTSHSRNNLSLLYSFPLYSGEEIKYQYKVEGLTEEWSKLSEKPDFTISRIPPGDYTIMVRATNDWQKSSAIHEMQLTVKPPWYQSTVAIILYALFFFALFFIGKHVAIRRVRLHEKQKREEKEREVIRLRNEKLQNEISFKSRQLANSALAMAKKNEFLMELKKKLKSQKEQLGSRYPDK
ncbi:MAG: triple tyrosine motif-containing protein, partial [Bacteroidota bacterium]